MSSSSIEVKNTVLKLLEFVRSARVNNLPEVIAHKTTVGQIAFLSLSRASNLVGSFYLILCLIVLLMLYVQVNDFSFMLGCLPGLNQ